MHTVRAVSVISKAFSCKDGKIRLLNPELNAQRMQKGAGALLTPGSNPLFRRFPGMRFCKLEADVQRSEPIAQRAAKDA